MHFVEHFPIGDEHPLGHALGGERRGCRCARNPRVGRIEMGAQGGKPAPGLPQVVWPAPSRLMTPIAQVANAALGVLQVARGCVEFAGEGLMRGKRGAKSRWNARADPSRRRPTRADRWLSSTPFIGASAFSTLSMM